VRTMNTIVLHVRAAELHDALCFNRLKADIRKIVQDNCLVIVHGSQASVPPERDNSPQIAALTTLNKTLAAKLSEELLPAVALAAHHLGLATSSSPDETGWIIRPKALLHILHQGGIPIIAPIIKNAWHQEKTIQSEELAAKVAAAIQADLLIFLIEPKEAIQDEVKRHVMPENKYAVESLRAGTKRAFLTDMGGMEQVLLHHKAAPVEVFDNNQ
jgi:acetylglutamate kinase